MIAWNRVVCLTMLVLYSCGYKTSVRRTLKIQPPSLEVAPCAFEASGEFLDSSLSRPVAWVMETTLETGDEAVIGPLNLTLLDFFMAKGGPFSDADSGRRTRYVKATCCKGDALGCGQSAQLPEEDRLESWQSWQVRVGSYRIRWVAGRKRSVTFQVEKLSCPVEADLPMPSLGESLNVWLSTEGVQKLRLHDNPASRPGTPSVEQRPGNKVVQLDLAANGRTVHIWSREGVREGRITGSQVVWSGGVGKNSGKNKDEGLARVGPVQVVARKVIPVYGPISVETGTPSSQFPVVHVLISVERIAPPLQADRMPPAAERDPIE